MVPSGRGGQQEEEEEGRRGGDSSPLPGLPRQKGEEQEERTEKNGKEHGRRRSAPPLEIIACSRGISECGRKAANGERQGPQPRMREKGKERRPRDGRTGGRAGAGAGREGGPAGERGGGTWGCS